MGFRPGRSTERYGAAFILAAWFVTPLVQTKGVIGLDIGTTSVDIALLAALLWLSLKSRELWVAFAAAFQFLCVTGHFASWLAADVSLFTYITGNGIWGGFALLGALAVGLIGSKRARRKN